MMYQYPILQGISLVIMAGGVAFADCPNPFPKSPSDEQIRECLADVGKLRSEIDNLKKTPQPVQNVQIPTGAVLAFDLPDGCPDGWVPFDRAQSRVILGAANNHGAAIGNQDAIGRPLTPRPYQADGGVETTLVPSLELGTHDDYQRGQGGYRGLDGVKYKDVENRPLSNMMPFVALYYCKKR